MLQSGEVIDAYIVGNRRIVFAAGCHANERGRSTPGFVRCIREENSGRNFIGDGTAKQAAGLLRDGNFIRLIGEGEDISWKENRRRGLGGSRGLVKTVVEAAAARSCHVRENAVESDPSLFIGIESL